MTGAPCGDRSYLSASTERQWLEYVAQRSDPRVQQSACRRPDLAMGCEAGWDTDQDEAARHRARRLLSRSNSGFHRFSDVSAAEPMGHRRTLGQALSRRDCGAGRDLCRLLRRGCGGGSAPARSISTWRRPGLRRRSRKISATAIRVEVGGTQIERAGEIASRCVSATSWSGTATRPSSPARRRPK